MGEPSLYTRPGGLFPSATDLATRAEADLVAEEWLTACLSLPTMRRDAKPRRPTRDGEWASTRGVRGYGITMSLAARGHPMCAIDSIFMTG